MTRTGTLLFLSFLPILLTAQTLSARLTTAFDAFEADAQLRNAITSLYVMEAESGSVVFERNGAVGLAPASTQKVITSASAYLLLGKDFRYRTRFGISPSPAAGSTGYIFILPGGDPTLGSWRWPQTTERAVLERVSAAARKAGIKSGHTIRVRDSAWEGERVPDGWIWQDIGNYYGAGASALNWRENQYDILLRSGSRIGSEVQVVGTVPKVVSFPVNSVALAAAKGTGDNAFVYYPLLGSAAIVRGTIPVGEKAFSISAAFPDPVKEFVAALTPLLNGEKSQRAGAPDELIFHTETSPPLDSIIFWFNKKSINLYGEALVKTIAVQGGRMGTTEAGIDLIKDKWESLGVKATELNLVDGSGLSPLNRVTTHAQVVVLLHARKQAWFGGFYAALPEYNGMKMKSGTIRGAKGFCGYHRSKGGREYIYSFLVNNYNGSATTLVNKMYRVLDNLK